MWVDIVPRTGAQSVPFADGPQRPGISERSLSARPRQQHPRSCPIMSGPSR